MSYPKHITCIVHLKVNRQILFQDAVLLFCIHEKCMSGKIIEVVPIDKIQTKIDVSLIEPTYFNSLNPGDSITLQEGKMVMAEGVIEWCFK
jgi:hypothetical protein